MGCRLYSHACKHSQTESSEWVLLTSWPGSQLAPPATWPRGWINVALKTMTSQSHPCLPPQRLRALGSWGLPLDAAVPRRSHSPAGERLGSAPQARTSGGIMSCSGGGNSFLIRRHMGLSQRQMGPKAPSPEYCPDDLNSHPGSVYPLVLIWRAG